MQLLALRTGMQLSLYKRTGVQGMAAQLLTAATSLVLPSMGEH